MRTIFVHSGLHKTGSTAIQKYLNENKKKLNIISINTELVIESIDIN